MNTYPVTPPADPELPTAEALDLLVERVLDNDRDAVRQTSITRADVLTIALSYGREEIDEPPPALLLLDEDRQLAWLDDLLALDPVAEHVDRRLRAWLERTSPDIIDEIAFDLATGDGDAAYDDYVTGGAR